MSKLDRVLIHAKAHIGQINVSDLKHWQGQGDGFKVVVSTLDVPNRYPVTHNSLLGLADLVEHSTKDQVALSSLLDKVFGQPSFDQEPFLINIDSILVSTGWNLNDDIFLKEEVWQARSTPNDKPIDWQHIQDEILGHMKHAICVDAEFNLIPDNSASEEVPEDFHIANRGVLYGMRFAQRIQEIQQRAEGNDLFMSMECWFSNYDYLVEGVGVIRRNESTSFLDQHLRCYGGNGEYDGKRIGRVLRDITFDGIGLVDRPANPDSVIYGLGQNETALLKAAASLEEDLAVQRDNIEPAKKAIVLESEVVKASTQQGGDNAMTVEELQKKVEDLEKEASDKDTKIQSLETEAGDKDQTIANLTQQVADKDAEIEDLKTQVADKDTAISEKDGQISEMKGKLDAIEKAKVGEARYAELIEISGAEVDNPDEEKARLADLSEVDFANEKVAAYQLQVKTMKEAEAGSDGDDEGNEDEDKAKEAAEALKKAEAKKADELAKAGNDNNDGDLRGIARGALSLLRKGKKEEDDE